MSNLRTGSFGNYWGSFFGESEALNQTMMEDNAVYIFSALTDKGWTRESIAAILGNMQAESSINPGRWQNDSVAAYSLGYGLVQWTPATKYTEWCAAQGLSDPSEMDSAIARIIYEVENGLQWIPTSAHDMTFSEFTKSTSDPATLAAAFLLNYERPADQSQSVQAYRGSLANAWFTHLTGETPKPPATGKTKKRKKYNFILFGRKSWRFPT